MTRILDIGIVADARHPLREPFAGGLEAHTHALATGLRARGHHVTVYASDTSDPSLGVVPVCAARDRLRLSDRARDDASMPAGGERFMEEHHAYLDLMLRLRGASHDVVHNASLHYLPVAMAPSLRRPVLTVLHTPPTPWIESAVACAPAPPCTFASVSAANARAWSHALEVRRVVPNGIDLDLWRAEEPDRPPYAVWTGRVVPEKAPHLAIDAARLAGLPLRLAGPVHDRAYFDAEVAPRLGPGAVHVGHLGREALAGLVGRASVSLVTPEWDEPYGLVVAESLACGTPVAAFARGAVPEIVTAATGRVVAGGDVEALAAAAVEARVLDRDACRRRAEEHCSAEVMTDRYEALYEELAPA